MKKKFSVGIGTAAVLILLAVLVTFQITYVALNTKYAAKLKEIEAGPTQYIYNKLTSVDELFRQFYIGEINETELVDGVIRGYMEASGDQYAQYMNSDEFDEFMNDLNGQLEGIGIIVVENKEYQALQIACVMPDSPALEAGLLPGDLIIEIDGIDVAVLGYYGAVSQMKGPAGSYTHFKILRGKESAEKIDMTVERRQIASVSVLSHIYEDGTNEIGIIKLLQFDSTTPEQLKSAVDGLVSQGAKRLVFDVRNNSGGELESVVSVLDYLLPEGPVIRIYDRDGNETVKYSEAGELDTNIKLIILVNENTASAAELFSAALRDYNKAKLVGVQTYGKGSVQRIIRLEDNSAIRVTYRTYSPPLSEGYDQVGLTPDYVVALSDEAAAQNPYVIADIDDNQLMEAINQVRDMN